HYRVTPVLVGRVPSGLRSPAWWGLKVDLQGDPYDADDRGSVLYPDDAVAEGVVLTGAALASAGLRMAEVNPEHAYLVRAEAVEG
ncbi:MAG: alpha-galactosidase, partial [Actinomycetes bacterium]